MAAHHRCAYYGRTTDKKEGNGRDGWNGWRKGRRDGIKGGRRRMGSAEFVALCVRFRFFLFCAFRIPRPTFPHHDYDSSPPHSPSSPLPIPRRPTHHHHRINGRTNTLILPPSIPHPSMHILYFNLHLPPPRRLCSALFLVVCLSVLSRPCWRYLLLFFCFCFVKDEMVVGDSHHPRSLYCSSGMFSSYSPLFVFELTYLLSYDSTQRR